MTLSPFENAVSKEANHDVCMIKMVVPFCISFGLTFIIFVVTNFSPVTALMYSSDGVVQWNTDGVRLSRLGCGVTRLHCCWNVSSGVRRMMANLSVPLIREILMAPEGFLLPSIPNAL